MPADYLGVFVAQVETVEGRHRKPALSSPKREAPTACAQPMRPAFFALELYPPPGPTLTSCVYRRSVEYSPAPVSPHAVPHEPRSDLLKSLHNPAADAAYSKRLATFLCVHPGEAKALPVLNLHTVAGYRFE